MILTNKNNLPEAIVKAVKNDRYDAGDSDFTPSSLNIPSRAFALKRKHWDELTEDVSDRFWALLGQLGHQLLERANMNDLAEKRFFGKFGDFKVSAQIDSLCLENGVLSDFKFSTAWAFMAGRPAKPEWASQMNIQLELLRQNGMDASKLQIVGLLRDWQIKEAGKGRYPAQPIAIVDVPMWGRQETVDWVEARIKSHMSAMDSLPLCTDEETWSGRRCGSYCVCSSVCEQYLKTKQNKQEE